MLPKEVAESPFFKILKMQVDMVLSNLV